MFFRTDPCRMDIGIAPDDDGAGLRGKTMRRSVPGQRNVRVGPEEKSNGRLRKSGGSERRRTGSGRYCGPGGVRGGGEVNCAACSNRENSGRFRLCGCAIVRLRRTEPAVRSGKISRIGRGVMMRRTPEKRPKGPCPGISRPVPSVVWGGDYSTVSETRKSSPEAGSVTTMLRSSLVKWK